MIDASCKRESVASHAAREQTLLKQSAVCAAHRRRAPLAAAGRTRPRRRTARTGGSRRRAARRSGGAAASRAPTRPPDSPTRAAPRRRPRALRTSTRHTNYSCSYSSVFEFTISQYLQYTCPVRYEYLVLLNLSIRTVSLGCSAKSTPATAFKKLYLSQTCEFIVMHSTRSRITCEHRERERERERREAICVSIGAYDVRAYAAHALLEQVASQRVHCEASAHVNREPVDEQKR